MVYQKDGVIVTPTSQRGLWELNSIASVRKQSTF